MSCDACMLTWCRSFSWHFGKTESLFVDRVSTCLEATFMHTIKMRHSGFFLSSWRQCTIKVGMMPVVEHVAEELYAELLKCVVL
uniref:Uncharacterized protein n=1 Tax=Aegilops tauschii subsp. strangulata TaxID=200361 RepID=A0A453BFS7_AEGTS